MRTHLAYDKEGLTVELPVNGHHVTVIEPSYQEAIADPQMALTWALRAPMSGPPLRDLARDARHVGIVFSDITRPSPNHLLLPALLDELEFLPREQITLFNALGTHRPNTVAELEGMLGDDPANGDKIARSCRIVQNDAFDRNTQMCIGKTGRGVDVWINRAFGECDFKILTGFIEPHFFAGFSGGGKAIMPGMAGEETVLRNHDAENIGNLQSTWGVTHGNPIWEEIHEAAALAGPDFLLNVTLNKEKAVTGVFAGEMMSAYKAGTEFVRTNAMVAVDSPFDIAITTNSGYPLDLNLYQAVKGMSAAAQVVRPGGAMIIAASCWDGIPDHGLYGTLLRQAESPSQLLRTVCAPGFLKQDQWTVQVQALIQERMDVYVYSHHLSDRQITDCLLKPCADIAATTQDLLAAHGDDARICVLPEGPQAIPYVRSTT